MKDKSRPSNEVKSAIEVTQWWADTQAIIRRYETRHSEMINRDLESLPTEKRYRILNYLTHKAIFQRSGYEDGLSILEYWATEDHIQSIYDKALTLSSDDPEYINYLRVIGKRGKECHKDILEKFLFTIPYNSARSCLHWSLYPNYPDLFVKSYCEYLVREDNDRWRNSAISQGFMFHGDALKLLKKYMVIEAPITWLVLKKVMTYHLATFTIITEKQKEAVRDALRG